MTNQGTQPMSKTLTAEERTWRILSALGLGECADETWLPAPEYEGRYEVSTLGRIRSLPRIEPTSSGAARSIAGGLLRPMKNIADGYLQVSLRKDGKMRTVRLHRLVCRAFHGEPGPLKNEAAHLDGDRANCRADNLKWVTKAENRSHRLLHGTDDRGERHASAKLTNEQADEIRAALNPSIGALADRYGVSRGCIEDVRRGRTYRRLTIDFRKGDKR